MKKSIAIAVVIFLGFFFFSISPAEAIKAPAKPKVKKVVLVKNFLPGAEYDSMVAPPTEEVEITLAWDPVEGATGYKIYHGYESRTVAPYPYSKDVENKTTGVISVKQGHMVFIAVTAYNNTGESDFSDELPYLAPVKTDPNGFVSDLGAGEDIEVIDQYNHRLIGEKKLFSDEKPIFILAEMEGFNFPHKLKVQVVGPDGFVVLEKETEFRYPEQMESYPYSSFAPGPLDLFEKPAGFYWVYFSVFTGGKEVALEPFSFQLINGPIVSLPYFNDFTDGIGREIFVSGEGVETEHSPTGGYGDDGGCLMATNATGSPEAMIGIQNILLPMNKLVSGVVAIRGSEPGIVVLVLERNGSVVFQREYDIGVDYKNVFFAFPSRQEIPVGEARLVAKFKVGKIFVDAINIDSFSYSENLPYTENFNIREPLDWILTYKSPAKAELIWRKDDGYKDSAYLEISNHESGFYRSDVQLKKTGFSLKPEHWILGYFLIKGNVGSESPIYFEIARTDTTPKKVLVRKRIELSDEWTYVFFSFISPKEAIAPENIVVSLQTGLFPGTVKFDQFKIKEVEIDWSKSRR